MATPVACPCPHESQLQHVTEAHLIAAGVPQAAIDEGKKAGLAIPGLWALLLQIGLPALMQLLALWKQKPPVPTP